ncbi:unnamed protein product [Allacma fusca]|uniref:Uncharacterized protein n=1 Tax=Allacma fusca TaxID=39272 RepID=A0A8J2NY24_9HEXA|nr:unnamed protein product [Allacma fusca]
MQKRVKAISNNFKAFNENAEMVRCLLDGTMPVAASRIYTSSGKAPPKLQQLAEVGDKPMNISNKNYFNH